MKALDSRRFSVLLLGCVLVGALLAGFLSCYDPAEQNRDYPYSPPARLHWFDANGKFHFVPFVYAWQMTDGEFREDARRPYPLRFFAPGFQYRFAGLVPASRHLVSVEEPATLFLLGTDGLGRDQWSRLLFGARVTVLAGLLAAALALSLGVVLGSIAGYFGGILDTFLMRLVELFLAVPWLYLLFAVRAFLPLSVPPLSTFFLIVLVIGCVGWARPARLIRGVARSVRTAEYVEAARGAGASAPYLIWRHILPHTGVVVRTQAALLIPQYMLAEITLSFLGLGVAEPIPSWGSMLQPIQQYPVLRNDWWMLVPALVMIPIFWAFAVLADQPWNRIQFPLI